MNIHDRKGTLEQLSASNFLSSVLQILQLLSQIVSDHWWMESCSSLMMPLFHIDCEQKFNDHIRTQAHVLWLRYFDYISSELIYLIMRENLVPLICRISVSLRLESSNEKSI